MMSLLDPAPTPDDEDFIAEENYSTLQSLLSTQTEEEGDSIKVMLLFQTKMDFFDKAIYFCFIYNTARPVF